MNPSLWWWAVPAVLLCWSVGAHNRLVRQRAEVLQALGEVETYLQQWTADALALAAPVLAAPADAAVDPSAAPAVASTPPEYVALHAAARQADTARGALRARPLEPALLAALAAACDVLATASQRVEEGQAAADGDATPAAASPAAPVPAAPLSRHAAHLRVARDRFNAAVARYHAAIRQFPACVLAWLLRMPRTRPL